jgi:hypothetical protein
MLAPFSCETEVTLSTPTNPRRLSSIFNTTPSSISAGEAPGYWMAIVMILEVLSGKKDDLVLEIPIMPNMKVAPISTFTATGYFMKKDNRFFIDNRAGGSLPIG